MLSGQNAKTNFPRTPKDQTGDAAIATPTCDNNSFFPPKSQLSDLLNRKIRNCCKDSSPSLTCLRLDDDNSHIGVWQKGAGPHSESNWIIRVELGNKHVEGESNVSPGSTPNIVGDARNNGVAVDEEDTVSMQMIEELLNWNHPCSSSNLQE